MTTTTTTTLAPAPALDWPDATGAGVTVVLVDRVVDWRHPDLRHADGTTRLAAVVDVRHQVGGCAAGRPDPIVHLRGAIDDALAGDPGLVPTDGSGHGTALAGLAVGNGAASGGEVRGAAPDTDLVVVALTDDGVDDGDDGDRGSVTGCIDDAMDVVDLLLAGLDQPAVALFGTGSQWGPIDGTSAASRRIAESFGPDRPGRVMVTAAGDEGDLPNHARADVAPGDTFVLPFDRADALPSNPTIWYSGGVRASISVQLDDPDDAEGDVEVIGPVGPGESVLVDGVAVIQYEPGREFHPWTSTSGDRAAWILIDRPAGTGRIVVEVGDGTDEGGDADSGGRVDVYGDVAGPTRRSSSIEFADALAEGRLADVAATPGAVVATAYVARTSWFDRLGRLVDQSPEVGLGERWPGASAGPTRDGRVAITVAVPGHHAVAPLAAGSQLAERDELVPALEALDATGDYVVVSGTAPAAALLAGTVAAMLEVAPELTATQVAAILRMTAITDELTGEIDPTDPDVAWGAGKLDPRAAVEAAATAAG